MKKLNKRLNIPEVLDFTRQNGRFAAMDKFDIRDYPAFVKFLKEETGDENFGIQINRPRIEDRPVDIQLFQAYSRKVSMLKNLARIRREGKRLDAHIERLEQQLLELEEAREHREELVLI